MPGKPKDDPAKTQQEEIAEKKAEYLRFYSEFPVQKAAADFIGRSPATIQDWQNNDPDFSASVSRTKADWAKRASRRVRPDNVLANLYDELKPPKQEIDAKVTTIEGQSADDLLAEAKRLGLDTTPYESLLTGNCAAGTSTEDSAQKGA